MSAITSALIGAGGSVLGSVIGNQGQKSSANKQMEWAEYMYKNRYQMQVEDMRKAGLNPMLAIAQSPGTTPQGAKADIKSPTQGMMEAAFSAASLDKLEADTAASESVTALNEQNARKAAAEADLFEESKEWERKKYDVLNRVADFATNFFSNNAPTAATGIKKLGEALTGTEISKQPYENRTKSQATVQEGYWAGAPLPPYPKLTERDYKAKTKAWKLLEKGQEPDYSDKAVFKAWNQYRSQMGINN